MLSDKNDAVLVRPGIAVCKTNTKLQWSKSLRTLFLAHVSVQYGLRESKFLSPSGFSIPRILRISDASTGNSSGCWVKEENESMEVCLGDLSVPYLWKLTWPHLSVRETRKCTWLVCPEGKKRKFCEHLAIFIAYPNHVVSSFYFMWIFCTRWNLTLNLFK